MLNLVLSYTFCIRQLEAKKVLLGAKTIVYYEREKEEEDIFE
jgi:hypothetical protein